MKKEKYICNGKTFASYEDVMDYCDKRGFRITNTTTMRKGVYLIDVTSK